MTGSPTPELSAANAYRARLFRRRLLLAGYWIALCIGTHLPRFTVGVEAPSVIALDKVLHFIAYAGLTTLVFWARPWGWLMGPRLGRLIGTLVVIGYGYVDEQSQAWVGRTVDPADFHANLMGILTVYLIASAPSGLTRWPPGIITACRAVWLAVVPAIVMMAVTPQAGVLIHRLRLISRRNDWNLDTDQEMHFLAGMVITWLLAIAYPATRGLPRLSAALTIGVMIIAAPAIEWAQQSLGRGSPSSSDVHAHMEGLRWALIIWAGAVALLAPPWNRLLDRLGVKSMRQRLGRVTKAFDPTADARFVGRAALVSLLTLVSRLTGLVRDATLAAAFGLGAVADAFAVGFMVPNLFRRLFGEGALTAAFIPHYTDLLRNDPKLARRFASLCVAALVVLLSAITIAGQVVLYELLSSGGWDERGALSIRLVMVMLPYMPMVCVVALLGGVLQVHRKFGPAAVAPILLNLTIVGFALWAGIGQEDEQSQRAIAYIAASAVLVAGLVQVGYLLINVQRTTKLTYHFRGAWPTLRKMLWMMVPMVLGLAVFQINALMDVFIAMWLSPGTEDAVPTEPILGMFEQYPMKLGDIAALGWAQRLYQFPLGVFGIAIATAIFPALAAAVKDEPGTGKTLPGEKFADTLRQGLRLTVFIGLPASIGLLLVREPLARLIYMRANFTAGDAHRVAVILLGYAPAIWAYSMTHVLTRAFHALKDAKTPLAVAVVMVCVNLSLNLMLVWHLGARGLASSTAATAVIQCGVLLALVRRKIADPVDRAVFMSWMKTLVAAMVMGVALWSPGLFFTMHSDDQVTNALLLAVLVVGGGIVFLIAAKLLRCEELGWLKRRR